MTKAGERLLEGAREALAIARGEQPAHSIHHNGFRYISEDAVKALVATERERCAALAEDMEIVTPPEWVKVKHSIAQALTDHARIAIAIAIRAEDQP